jgi:predicted nucleotidyltransferase
MVTREFIRQKRDAILEIARRYGASDVRIFGSVARGDATESSDLDILVRLEPGRSLIDQGGLLDMKVDVITEGALEGRFGQIVRREAVPL